MVLDLGIKCSDTAGVGLALAEILDKMAGALAHFALNGVQII